MVEDSTIRDSSPVHMNSKGSNKDPNDSFGPVLVKEMCVSPGSRDPSINEQRQIYCEDSVNNCGHLKDTLVDEGVSSRDKNDLGSEENYKLRDPTQAEVSESLQEISFEILPNQADVVDSLDFGSLLDQVELGSIMSGGICDDIIDKSYLDELLASTNNPFLEDLPVQTRRECERDAVNASNPFEAELSIDEPEDSCVRPEELSLRSSLVDRAVAGKNPFLDTESFKAAKHASDEAMKVSVAVATLGEEKKTDSDDKAGTPCSKSIVDSGSPRAADIVNVFEHTDNPANAAKLQLDPFESSFATTNPYPTLISHSGQIPFSGSISHRSESSATSNRSFAFPVLQPEWNASPVRMAKANRKHNSWRHSLLCCNF